MKKFIYLDIDGVLCLGSETSSKFHEEWGWSYSFNKKAVEVLNKVLDKTNADIIISSDWKDHFTLEQLQKIFEYNGVKKAPIDVTITYPNKLLEFLERDRTAEILDHVKKHNPEKWIAIDDLNLGWWLNQIYPSDDLNDHPHFVYCSRFMEGIKQSGKFNEIIQKLC